MAKWKNRNVNSLVFEVNVDSWTSYRKLNGGQPWIDSSLNSPFFYPSFHHPNQISSTEPSVNTMASFCLVLITVIVIYFCQFPANASQMRVVITHITHEPMTLRYTIQFQLRTPLQIQHLAVDIKEEYMWVRCDKKI